MHQHRQILLGLVALALALAACGSGTSGPPPTPRPSAPPAIATPVEPSQSSAPGAAASPRPEPWRIVGFSFVNPTEGWLVRMRGYSTGPMQVLHTTDAGDTWTAQSEATDPIPTATNGATWAAIGQPPCSPARQITMLTAAVGWVLCSGAGASGFVEGALYQTTDGARTWHPVSQFEFGDPTPAPGVGQLPSAGGHFQFLDQTRGWLTTGDHGPYSYSTADGGHTWQASQTPLSDSLQSLDFVDANHGWVANGTHIARTTDAGQHWALLALPD